MDTQRRAELHDCWPRVPDDELEAADERFTAFIDLAWEIFEEQETREQKQRTRNPKRRWVDSIQRVDHGTVQQ